MMWPDRRAFQKCVSFEGTDCRIVATIFIPRHGDVWHVQIWDEFDLDHSIEETAMTINHPGFASVDEAKTYAQTWLDKFEASL
jgi:hypothetical protein